MVLSYPHWMYQAALRELIAANDEALAAARAAKAR